MKLPNGYGSVSKVNRKNLRKKYIARITTDIEIDEQGIEQKENLEWFAAFPVVRTEFYRYNKCRIFPVKEGKYLWKENNMQKKTPDYDNVFPTLKSLDK